MKIHQQNYRLFERYLVLSTLNTINFIIAFKNDICIYRVFKRYLKYDKCNYRRYN